MGSLAALAPGNTGIQAFKETYSEMRLLEKYSVVMKNIASNDGGTAKTISPLLLVKPSGAYVDTIYLFPLWYCKSS